jgi:hypothetical protein
MATIKIDLINRAADVPAPELPFNVVLAQKIPTSEESERADGVESVRPIRVSGLAEVARLAKPVVVVGLKNERGEDVQCRVDYSANVKGNDDVVAHLNSEWIHRNLESEAGRLNILLRLKAREELVKRLRNALASGSIGIGDARVALQELREELRRRHTALEQIW